jgi:type IV secretion system protein VirB11
VLVRDGTGRRLAELARVDGLDPVTGDYRLIHATFIQGDTP